MTGKINTALSSVLPLDARAARIAADGGVVVSLQHSPGEETGARNGYHPAGFEPDDLDFIPSQTAESRIASSPSMPGRSVRTVPILNSNPT